ncbi:hypothetical protein J5N97_014558 [Dioscorea zingiberensis]|uniref:Uncharacterized protein n=1 Tax=Dioscorea zingiberensis TaxID=325984 RepID=A0A9D5HJR7_9LILI|nr:hypothetical protein J5N97_014558 [Dioscorea zingiberensis]
MDPTFTKEYEGISSSPSGTASANTLAHHFASLHQTNMSTKAKAFVLLLALLLHCIASSASSSSLSPEKKFVRDRAQPRKLLKPLVANTSNLQVSKATAKQTTKSSKESFRKIPRSGSNPIQN